MSAVIYEKKGSIANITLNRPDKLNALNEEMVEGLQEAWQDFRDDNNLWVAILSGSGRSFCAGADVTATPAKDTPKKETVSMRGFSKALRTTPNIFDVWKPVICAVHGHTYGAGAWLALNCDLIIAAEDTRLCAPEVKLSRMVNFAVLLSRFMPMSLASEFLLVGDVIPPERAYQLGLFNKVVPNTELLPAATKIAQRICENGPVALRATKEALKRSVDIPSYEGKLELAEQLSPQVMNSEDYQEGAAAFREKRKPVWKNR